MTKRLDGKTAIITGGGGGIGAATARLFCVEGSQIVLVDRDADALACVVAELRANISGSEVVDIIADVAEEASASRIVTAARNAFGKIDIVVNNAGIRAYEPLAEAKSKTWHTVLSVNLLSYAYLAREALTDLRASGRGSIINISSTHAVNPRAGMGQYDVAKAGVVSLTKTLAFEEARHGVRVNAVCPGLTMTPFHLHRAEKTGRSMRDLENEAIGTCLMKRWADPREVAFPILWLASDEASYVTASVLMVDGGRLVV